MIAGISDYSLQILRPFRSCTAHAASLTIEGLSLDVAVASAVSAEHGAHVVEAGAMEDGVVDVREEQAARSGDQETRQQRLPEEEEEERGG